MNPSLYDVLGVTPDAERDEIKRAWREAADRFEPGSGGSTAQFRLFNEAAEVLLDPERRKEYDAQAGMSRTTSTATLTAPAPRPTEAEPPVAPDDARGPEPSAGRRSVPTAVLAVLALVAALTVGAAVYLGVEHQRASAYQDALEQAPSAAERAAVAVLSYDHDSLESDRDAAAKFLTDSYRDDYVKTYSLVLENAPEVKARVTAEVLASAAMLQSGDRDGDEVPVLLYVNQTTVSTANSGEPSVFLNRVRFDMKRVDGTWLVDGITSY